MKYILLSILMLMGCDSVTNPEGREFKDSLPAVDSDWAWLDTIGDFMGRDTGELKIGGVKDIGRYDLQQDSIWLGATNTLLGTRRYNGEWIVSDTMKLIEHLYKQYNEAQMRYLRAKGELELYKN